MEMDPRIAAIMSKYDDTQQRKATVQETGKPKPPTTYEEFIKFEKVNEWPQRLTSEGLLDLEGEGLLLGTQQDIYNALKDTAPINMAPLDNLEEKLLQLEEKLSVFSDQILTEDIRPSRLQENLFYAPPKAFLTEMGQSDVVKVHHSRKKETADSIEENNKKSVEFCVFPGYHQGELIELPGQLETPQLLHRITKAQDFNAGFKKFWKKIFLSEASIAVMQDTFWWFFLHIFQQKGNEKDKDQLYDRIADSFVGLFTSINPDIKDKFFSVYPDCLAQALWTAFHEAFPDSRGRFQRHFKQTLCDITSEWVTGLKSLPNTWMLWKTRKLEFKALKGSKMSEKRGQKEGKHKLDFDGFEKLVRSLGNEEGGSKVGSSISRLSRTWRGAVDQPDTDQSQYDEGLATMSQTGGLFGRKPPPSHQVGPGPSFERVLFNIEGRSPLVSHYLYMRQLREQQQPGSHIRRTEIAAMPPPAPTYRQIIDETKQMKNKMKKEYQKICDEADAELLKLDKRQIETAREIEKLKRELTSSRASVDLKMMLDKKFDESEVSLPSGMVDIDSGSDKDY